MYRLLVLCVGSKESQEALNSWTHYDNQQDSFCETEGLHRIDSDASDLFILSILDPSVSVSG